jgi:HPt (histidine-containing phosphotransfer) domain-containing protein
MGDRDLEREILAMFAEQAKTVRAQIAKANTKERLFLAHALKGSARGVGAFAIAECAEAIEAGPADDLNVKRMARLIEEACDFIASIDR